MMTRTTIARLGLLRSFVGRLVALGRFALARGLFADGLVFLRRILGAAAPAAPAAPVAAILLLLAVVLFAACMLALFFIEQRLPVGDGDLVVIRVDFAEGEEAVAVAAIFDEGRLKRRLDACYLGKIDVAAKLLAVGALEIEFLDPVRAAARDDHPCLFGMGGVDKHLVVISHCKPLMLHAARRSAAELSSPREGPALSASCFKNKTGEYLAANRAERVSRYD